MRFFIIALQFLTIIPMPFQVRCEDKDLGRSMALFPLVGATLGLLLVGTDYLLTICLPRQVADLLLIVLLSIVTGALHLDGLADVCDGLAARGGRERFLAVMKDSRTGAVGVVGLVLGLTLKYQALVHIQPELKKAVLLLFPMVARYAQVQVAVRAKSARMDGLGTLFIGGVGITQLVIAGVSTAAAAILLLGVKGLYCVLILAAFTWALRYWSHSRLGGITGDIIGCISELNEILFLLLVLAMCGGTP